MVVLVFVLLGTATHENELENLRREQPASYAERLSAILMENDRYEFRIGRFPSICNLITQLQG